jgi:membrane-associated phospholipid phosphatase
MNINRTIFLIITVGTPLLVLCYFYIDIPVGRWAIAHDETFVSKAGDFVSLFGESTYWLIASALLWLFWRFKHKNKALASRAGFFFLSIVITGLGSNVLKLLFGKARPIVLKHDDFFGFTWLVTPADYDFHSFPSGHTTTAFTIATALALMFPRYWYFFYGYGFAMALSRIAAWNHYPSDVIGGAMFGTVVTLLLYKSDRISFKKYS